MNGKTLERRLSLTLVGLTTLLLILSLAALSLATLRVFRDDSMPELQRKAATVALSLSTDIRRAVELGVPLAKLSGAEDFFNEAVAPHSEFRYAAFSDPQGAVLYASSGVTERVLPAALDEPVTRQGIVHSSYRVEAAGELIGLVHVGVDAEYVARRLTDILFDIVVTLLASLLVTFEVVLILVALNITIPINSIQTVIHRGIRGRFDFVIDSRSGGEMKSFIDVLNSVVISLNMRSRAVADRLRELGAAPLALMSGRPRRYTRNTTQHIRLPVFIFFFAAELPRSFLPIFASDVYQPLLGLPRDIVVALPISAFMLTVLLLTPIAGTLVARFGSRRAFVLGLVPSAIGFAMIGLSTTLIEMTVWRCVNAAGLAMVAMASLGYIADVTNEQTRAQGMATYLGAYVAAGVCGTAIGAILAERIGFGPVFLISAAAAVLSGAMIFFFMPPERARHAERRSLQRAHILPVLTNPSLMALQLLFALPIQIITFGYLFFIAPFLLREIGLTQSQIGRVIMLYFMAVILVGPLVARWADKRGHFLPFIIFGSIIAGASCVALLGIVNMWVVVASAVALGLSSAIGTPAAGGMLLKICAEQFPHVPSASIMGIYRVIERSGGVAGPLIASVLAGHYGYAEASGMIGAAVLLAGLTYGVLSLAALRRQRAASAPG